MGADEILELTARLAEIHGGLTRAHDASAFLLAVAGALGPFAPDYIDLAYIDHGADGAPEIFEVVESWREGAGLVSSPLVGGRFPVADFAVAQMMLRSAQEPQVLPDIGSEPELAGVMSRVGRALTTAVVLPLFSERQGTWQGVVGVYWISRHDPGERERAMYVLLMRMFAETLASQRTQRALRDSLLRNEALLQHTEAALRDAEAQKATLRVLLDNLPLGVAVVNGRSGQRELVNHHGVRLLGEHGEAGAEIQATHAYVYRPGEATPMPPEQLPHTRTLATGETQKAELEFGHEAGQRSLLEVTTSLLRYPGDPEPRVILLYQDITAVRRRELERLRAQDALLTAQAHALVERSTPLLPIGEDVLVMPIIGTIDAERGRQILETLVHLGGAAHVRAAIIDITGVRELDTAAASTLVQAALALRLRGVRPIVTGIQPVVAATLAGLGVDLSVITIHGTLQSAIAAVGLR